MCLLTTRVYAPPTINNYPAKSRGISPDELSHTNKTTLLEVRFPTPFLIDSVYIDINLQ